jgi:hypothetical protein
MDMTPSDLIELLRSIVSEAVTLRDKHTKETSAPVNYACVFCQSTEEYESLLRVAETVASVVERTPTGPLYRTTAVQTVAGNLQLFKIRQPDPTRKERGDADFTVGDYSNFKKTYLKFPQFKLIDRRLYQMIELTDPDFNVRVYFSNPPLDQQLGN